MTDINQKVKNTMSNANQKVQKELKKGIQRKNIIFKDKNPEEFKRIEKTIGKVRFEEDSKKQNYILYIIKKLNDAAKIQGIFKILDKRNIWANILIVDKPVTTEQEITDKNKAILNLLAYLEYADDHGAHDLNVSYEISFVIEYFRNN